MVFETSYSRKLRIRILGNVEKSSAKFRRAFHGSLSLMEGVLLADAIWPEDGYY